MTDNDALLGAIVHYTQSEYADRFVVEYAHEFRYIAAEDNWLHYDDGRWREDQYDSATHFCEKMCRVILAETSEFYEDEESGKRKRNPWHETARARCGAGSIAGVLRLARTRRPIVTRRGKFDQNPYLINVANGTFDLLTGKLRKPRPADMITYTTTGCYDSSAKGPTFDRYFAQVQPSAIWRNEIIRSLAYSLPGTYGDYIFIHSGSGGNGKTTLLKLVQIALGDYASSLSWKILNAKANESHETILAELEGVHLGIIQMQSHPISSEQLRTLVAEPDFKARRMQQDSRTIEASHTLHIAQNNTPRLSDLDPSTRRRIIAFNWSVTIDQPRDDLLELLRNEIDYIVTLLIDTYSDMILDDISFNRDATEEYLSNTNSVYGFVKQRCESHPSYHSSADDLYQAYVKHCANEGIGKVTQNLFGRSLSQLGYERTRTSQQRGWAGIRLSSN